MLLTEYDEVKQMELFKAVSGFFESQHHAQ